VGYIKAPFLQFQSSGTITGVFPSVDEENPMVHDGVEALDNVSASGKRLRYVVGDRKITEVTFRWQSDGTTGDSTDTKTDWETWWAAVKAGETFQYYDDDTVTMFDTTTTFDTTLIYGDNDAANAVGMTNMVTDDTEFLPTQEEVEGYWQITIRMREAV
jgi:hypothetical protein